MGYSGLASNLAGIQWLANMIGHFGYEVVPVRLHPHILHLDCALSLLREGLMIVCEEAFWMDFRAISKLGKFTLLCKKQRI